MHTLRTQSGWAPRYGAHLGMRPGRGGDFKIQVSPIYMRNFGIIWSFYNLHPSSTNLTASKSSRIYNWFGSTVNLRPICGEFLSPFVFVHVGDLNSWHSLHTHVLDQDELQLLDFWRASFWYGPNQQYIKATLLIVVRRIFRLGMHHQIRNSTTRARYTVKDAHCCKIGVVGSRVLVYLFI